MGHSKTYRRSIRFTVVSIFIMAVVVTATVALSLQYYFTKSIAEESTTQMFGLTSKITRQHIASVNAKARRSIMSLSQFPELTNNINFDENVSPALMKILENNPDFYAFYFGYDNGDFHQIVNLDASPVIRKQIKATPWDRWVVVNVSGEGKNRTRRFSYLDAQLNLRITREEFSDYQANERTWYINAKEGSVFKTDPYLFQHLQAPGQTYSTKLPGKNIVLSIDLALSTFAEFLMENGKNEQGITDREVFLFQKSGEVIASNIIVDEVTKQKAIPKILLNSMQQTLIDNAPVLKVSNEMDWAPIDFSVSGRPQGYSIETLELVSKMTGLEFEFINGYTWSELISLFEEEKIDILQPIMRTPKNEALGTLSSSIISLPFSLVTQAGVMSISSLSQLEGKALAIPKGWSVITRIKEEFPLINIVEVESTKALLEAVISGQVGAGLDNTAVLEFAQSQFFISGIDYHDDVNFLLEIDNALHLLMSEKARPYLDIINIAIESISFKKKEELENKWLNYNNDAAESNGGIVPYKILLELADDQLQHKKLIPYEIDGVDHYVIVSPVNKEVNEFFAIVIPMHVVQADAVYKIKWSILLTSLCLFMTLPVSWLFSSPIVNPIRLLSQQNEKIAARKYSQVQMIDSNIKEIHELAQSLVDMSKAIEQHEKNQKELMEAFIKLIAQAIDDKSAYTAGHCNRVPELGLMLAEVASDSNSEAFNSFTFENEEQHREFRIAAWLHDCGKITTPEHIVDKGSKLETIYNRIHEIRMRFEVLWRDAEINYYQALIENPNLQTQLQDILEKEQAQLQEDFNFIATSNVGGEFMDEKNITRLQSLASTTWQRYFDDRIGLSPVEELNLSKEAVSLPATEQLLSDKPEHIIKRANQPVYDPSFGIKVDVPEHLYNLGELYNLSIGRGTLTTEDRFKINEHIISTIKMLENLPFPDELANVPRYASTHHETLKGTGYPRKLAGDDLSIPERVLVLADIFEALTAADRPYKKAKPLSVSVNILHKFVLDENIDIDLFELFLTSGTYLKYAERFLKKEQIDEFDISKFLR